MKTKHLVLIGIGAAIATAAILLIRKRSDGTEKPPKKAPQVPIENPGDQSEFITTASESEVG